MKDPFFRECVERGHEDNPLFDPKRKFFFFQVQQRPIFQIFNNLGGSSEWFMLGAGGAWVHMTGITRSMLYNEGGTVEKEEFIRWWPSILDFDFDDWYRTHDK